MRSGKTVFSFVLMLIAAGLVLYANLAGRLYDPDASETRLFLRYWPWYAVGLLIGVVSYFLVARDEKKADDA